MVRYYIGKKFEADVQIYSLASINKSTCCKNLKAINTEKIEFSLLKEH